MKWVFSAVADVTRTHTHTVFMRCTSVSGGGKFTTTKTEKLICIAFDKSCCVRGSMESVKIFGRSYYMWKCCTLQSDVYIYMCLSRFLVLSVLWMYALRFFFHYAFGYIYNPWHTKLFVRSFPVLTVFFCFVFNHICRRRRLLSWLLFLLFGQCSLNARTIHPYMHTHRLSGFVNYDDNFMVDLCSHKTVKFSKNCVCKI